MRNYDKDVMIDLETLGTDPSSAIIQIGACTMDESERFLASIDQYYYEKRNFDGYSYSEDTVKWWSEQSDEARASLTLSLYPDIQSALTAFTEWYVWITKDEDKTGIWANSPAFDLVILNHAYTVEKINVPWKFWQERCYRTMKGEFNWKNPVDVTGLIKHRADHDAMLQARVLRAIMANLRRE